MDARALIERRAMSHEELLKLVTVNSHVCGGRPRIRDTRIDISVILDSLAEGLRPDEIIDHFPELTQKHIRAAAAYAGRLVREQVEDVPTSV